VIGLLRADISKGAGRRFEEGSGLTEGGGTVSIGVLIT